ncbi:MAG: 30S ribosomal protein S11 [Candidatus Pacebacteria bacterium]|nr:30S ribosomal protein S11 [Candidatus Paceibacterota bacterium]
MAKKKITTEDVAEKAEGAVQAPVAVKVPKKKLLSGTLHVEATFNNTKVSFSDKVGNTIFWSSSGSLGFKGAKKGTPFAASKVGETVGEKVIALGIKESDVIVKGVGSGREPAIRGFMSHGIDITGIKDATPVPHNGPKAKKPRRV